MAKGEVPEEVAQYLCGARLHGALKKDGGLRPIAVGNLLRRLTSKLVASELTSRAAGHLAPHQLGVGVRGGCEAIFHTVKQALEEDPTKWVLQGDFKNAFNLADRDATFQEVEKIFPECLSWVLSSYRSTSLLQYGDTTIYSETGFHQGDPLASLLFSLLLHPIVEKIETEVPDLKVNAWYLDDGTQVGSRSQLQKVVDILEKEGPVRGLHLSTSATVQHPDRPKSTVWCPTDLSSHQDDNLLTTVTRTEEAGTVLLRAPLGSQQYVREKLQKLVEKVQRITSLLPLLGDPHTESVLLRSCLGLPKMMYTLRAVETVAHQEILAEYDRVTREAIGRIVGVPLTNEQWLQANLPVSMGGLGLRTAKDHAPAAFSSSYLSSQPLLRLLLQTPAEETVVPLSPDLLNLLTELRGEESTMVSLEGLPQKKLSYEID